MEERVRGEVAVERGTWEVWKAGVEDAREAERKRVERQLLEVGSFRESLEEQFKV